MNVDTPKKKPTLYTILIWFAVLVGLVVVFVIFGTEQNAVYICGSLSLFFLAVLAELIITFFKQLKYNPYSYNTIYYMGFALFIISICTTLIILTVRMALFPSVYSVEGMLHGLLDSAKNYMLISSPFILVFSIALCISNISLIRHEGRRFVNVLGILLSVILLVGEAVIFLFDRFANLSGSIAQIRAHEIIFNLFAGIYLYLECMMIGTIIADLIAALHDPAKDKDFLIILGCSIRKDGTPTPLLKGRCDRAIAFYRKQKKETGKELIFITSGGQGSDERISESACMKQYLMSQGIPEKQIIEEDRSTNTFENMTFSKEIIQKTNPNGKTAFSTTNYHVFRSGLYARRVKLPAVGMGAPTKWYFWPNAAVREFIGLLKGHKGKQIIILSSLLVIYLLLTLFLYR